MKKLGISLIFLFVLGYLGYLGWKIYGALQGEKEIPDYEPRPQAAKPVEPQEPAEPKIVVEAAENTYTTSAEYRESEETQVMWMKRGQQIAIERFPGANRAEFRNTFYHRGFTYKPVACGEIQAWKDDVLVEDFQRFIYAGTRLVYFENQVTNFDIFWGKMCDETMEDPRP